MMTAFPFILLLALLLLGLPIAFSLAGAGLVGLWIVMGGHVEPIIGLVGASIYSTVSDYSLTTIPMFILMAFLISTSGIASGLFEALANWLSPLRGGMAFATVATTSIFGAMSGSSVAAAAAMSEISAPEMRKRGYAESLTSGCLAVGATTNVLIPPSIGMVIYGLMTDTSIGSLLIAGVLPGVLLAVLLCVVMAVWMRLDPTIAPPGYDVAWRVRFASLVGVWPAALLVAGVIGLLYSGLATPTEVAAIGAFGAALISLAMGRLTARSLYLATRQTLSSTAMIFIILVGAKVFGYFLTMTLIPQQLVAWVVSMNFDGWVVILFIVVAYFLISMVMDELPLMMLTLPLTFPVIIALGYDPVWFGVMTMLMVAMGLVFPPVGMVAFVVSASARIELGKVYKGCAILIAAIFLTTALVMIFPEIALYMPRNMRG